MYVYLNLCLYSICLSKYFHQSLCMIIYLYVRVYLIVCLYVCLYIWLYVYLYVCISDSMLICLSVYLTVCLSVCLYIWLYAYLSVCIYLIICMNINLCSLGQLVCVSQSTVPEWRCIELRRLPSFSSWWPRFRIRLT